MYRFGSRLMKLDPSMNAVTAAAHAAVAYEQHVGESAPEDVAAAFATENSGAVPVLPGNRSTRVAGQK